MSSNRIRKPFKKIALVLSICAILIWTALGTGVSLAWFADTSTEIKNIINFSTFKLSVEHRDDDGNDHRDDGLNIGVHRHHDRTQMFLADRNQEIGYKGRANHDVGHLKCYRKRNSSQMGGGECGKRERKGIKRGEQKHPFHKGHNGIFSYQRTEYAQI